MASDSPLDGPGSLAGGWRWLLTLAVLGAMAIILIEPVSALGAQVTDPDYLDDAGRIIGSPGAGPKPENPGDRGGYAQLLTLAVMVGGVGFIGWRVTRHLRN